MAGTVKAEGIELAYDLNFSCSRSTRSPGTGWRSPLSLTIGRTCKASSLSCWRRIQPGGLGRREKGRLDLLPAPNSLMGAGVPAYITVTNSRGRELKRIRFTVGTHNSLTAISKGGELQGLTELANIFPTHRGWDKARTSGQPSLCRELYHYCHQRSSTGYDEQPAEGKPSALG